MKLIVSKNSGFIILEFFFGMAFGILSVYIFSFYNKFSLFSLILYTFLTIYASALFGIGIIGFFHLKQNGRVKDFGHAIFYSFIGLIAFLIIYIIINALTFKLIPYYISSVLLPVILPIIGAVIGFNYKIFKKKMKSIYRK